MRSRIKLHGSKKVDGRDDRVVETVMEAEDADVEIKIVAVNKTAAWNEVADINREVE